MYSKPKAKPHPSTSKQRNAPHVSVMGARVVEWLDVNPDGTYVDCTAGAGGHSSLIAECLTGGRLIAIDRDADAIALARERLAAYSQAEVVQGNYGELPSLLGALCIEAVDGILIDAGVSSMQLDRADRGFSIQAEGPLDMRMDQREGSDAATFLSAATKESLAEVLREYGDVSKPKRIAKAILARRQSDRLHTTTDLAEAVNESLNVKGKNAQETYAVFQAIRIAVNEELRWLELGVKQGVKMLAPGGRIAVLSFHSGEDRVVKNVLKGYSRKRDMLDGLGRVAHSRPPLVKILTKKPELPDRDEIRDNPRARSAKLRVAERLATDG